MAKLAKWIVGLSLVAAIGTVSYGLFAPTSTTGPGASSGKAPGKKGRRAASVDAVPVYAAISATRDVPVFVEALGTARALNTVTVQPQVDGRILSINFREGQDVKKGDLLAKIDPALYEAQLKQAEAKKAQDVAQLADAKRELERNSSLGPIASLQKSIDTSRAKVAQLEALVKADEAAIDTARTQLGYTDVKAPIDGRTGIRMMDEGNIVRASSTTGIVVITQVQPIAVLFNLPQQQLPRVTAAMLAAKGAGLGVEVLGPDGRSVADRGKLLVIDNQVDQTTGTIRLKAELPNEKLQLWPGQFANIRMQVEEIKGGIVVPTAAVQQGPGGAFVYVVADGDTAKTRPVKVLLQDERRAVIGQGISAGEQVVTSSFARLRDAQKIAVTVAAESETGAINTAPAVPNEGRREAFQKGQGKGEGRGSRRREAGGNGTPPSQ